MPSDSENILAITKILTMFAWLVAIALVWLAVCGLDCVVKAGWTPLAKSADCLSNQLISRLRIQSEDVVVFI